METQYSKNGIAIIALLSLFVGVGIGYFLGLNSVSYVPVMNDMHQGYEYGREEELVRSDGAMMHAMDEMMLGFRGKTGQDFEEAFLKGMIVHHLGAVEMAEALLEETDRPELREFAQSILDVQSEEIETMKEWLQVWFNE